MGNLIRCCLPRSPRLMSLPAPPRLPYWIQRAAIAYDDLTFGERLDAWKRLDKSPYWVRKVFKGELHGMPVVIKKLFHYGYEWDTMHWADEIRLLSTLRHRNIVLFVGFSTDADDTCYLVTEYMERGDLGSIQKDPSTALSWTDQLLEFLIDICRGMTYLHAQVPEYIHGNLKAANVLIRYYLLAKLADCGLARLSTLRRHYDLQMPFWDAPEILRGDTCTSTVDVYSFGIVLAEIDTRKRPYHEHHINYASVDQLTRKIVHNKLRPTLSENVPASIASIYQRCVLDDPNGRPSFDQLKAEFESLRETLAAEVQESDIGQDALSTRTDDNFRVGGEDAHDAGSTTLPDDIRQVDFQPARVRSVARDTERNPALDRLYHALQRLEQQTANAPIAVAQELDFAKDALSARLNGDFCVEQKMAAC
ncbi:TKL/DRK protein kinase [Saprolegnia parasitica CBS 223.65]|uniref:TKL/DRK protein kinase n=1 Tax=Saprolegnia parasitica (strain CBS 223.65) TaxID=695850 RepID=A0A067BHP6_SAPPC|nr:TKL/DRK protein kinase [Saprolegnia parasitica CBS 223.65]KDO17924.1 TKL/DRK protein kinase [Saprolegnia parasitica CBS 223.65]|eukprot:XP_012211368.1 TKL/DRK protein kinase [Saprolegnia parasitica CBS 223.65]